MLDNSHIGRAFTINTLKGSIYFIEDDKGFKPKYSSFEGAAVEITKNYWILQADDGTKYKFYINHDQAYLLRRSLVHNQYQYVEGKGYGLVGYQGRIISGTWRVKGFTNWLYDPKTDTATKVNFANEMTGPHKDPNPNGASSNTFISMEPTM